MSEKRTDRIDDALDTLETEAKKADFNHLADMRRYAEGAYEILTKEMKTRLEEGQKTLF